MKNNTPLIFDIKRHALDDGPGIRTTLFFKGCPLRCLWCHNPESMDSRLEIGYYPADCIGCGDCVPVCPNGAVRMDIAERIDRKKCRRRAECVEACPGKGLRRIGRFYEIEELLEIVSRDRLYYQTSGGGVTLSGGEPTLNMDYASRLLRALKFEGIHTTIETCGFFDGGQFRSQMLDLVDLILFDVKLADARLHRTYTGKPNEVILRNLADLVRETPQKVLPRIPLIPGITATSENLEAIKTIFGQMGIRRCAVLPYNPLGFSKRQLIGKPPVELPGELLRRDELARIRNSLSGLELVEM